MVPVHGSLPLTSQRSCTKYGLMQKYLQCESKVPPCCILGGERMPQIETKCDDDSNCVNVCGGWERDGIYSIV